MSNHDRKYLPFSRSVVLAALLCSLPTAALATKGSAQNTSEQDKHAAFEAWLRSVVEPLRPILVEQANLYANREARHLTSPFASVLDDARGRMGTWLDATVRGGTVPNWAKVGLPSNPVLPNDRTGLDEMAAGLLTRGSWRSHWAPVAGGGDYGNLVLPRHVEEAIDAPRTPGVGPVRFVKRLEESSPGAKEIGLEALVFVDATSRKADEETDPLEVFLRGNVSPKRGRLKGGPRVRLGVARSVQGPQGPYGSAQVWASLAFLLPRKDVLLRPQQRRPMSYSQHDGKPSLRQVVRAGHFNARVPSGQLPLF